MSESGHENIPTNGIEQRFGWIHATDTEQVWNDRNHGAGWAIRNPDGDFDRYISRAKEKVHEGRSVLWRRLGTVEIDGIEIRQNSKIWHTEREEWLKAEAIDVTEDAEPKIRFRVDGSWPRRHITYYGEDLQRLRENGTIESQREVNDRAEEVLEQFRANSADVNTDV